MADRPLLSPLAYAPLPRRSSTRRGLSCFMTLSLSLRSLEKGQPLRRGSCVGQKAKLLGARKIRTRLSDDKDSRVRLIRYFRVDWVVDNAMISCIWRLMENRIRKNVCRYLASWIRERVTVVPPFSRVSATFVPPVWKCLQLKHCGSICVIFTPPCYVRTVFLMRLKKYLRALPILQRCIAVRKPNYHVAPVTEGLVGGGSTSA